MVEWLTMMMTMERDVWDETTLVPGRGQESSRDAMMM